MFGGWVEGAGQVLGLQFRVGVLEFKLRVLGPSRKFRIRGWI